MLKNFVKLFSGDPTKKTVSEFGDLAVRVNELEAQFEALSDEALRAKTDEFKARLAVLNPPLGGQGGQELNELEEKEQKIPNLTFPSTVEMTSSVLADAIEDSNIVGESVTLSLEPLKFTVRAESESTHANIEIPGENGTKITSSTTAKVKSKYSVEYLKKMMLGAKLSDQVTVHLNQDYPLKLEYKVVDKLSLNFILAPRVDND